MHKTQSDQKFKHLIAIGDIHGCLGALNSLLEILSEKYPFHENQIIFLGDYVDRGESSRGVIDLLCNIKLSHPHFRFLKGNHEELVLDGIPFGLYEGYSVFLEYDDQKISENHMTFIKNTEGFIESENFVFVHGGIPAKFEDIKEVPKSDFLWERGVWPGYQGKMVICGHTPNMEVRENKNYICIDTGCPYHNMAHLTAAVLNDQTGTVVEYVQVKNPQIETIRLRKTGQ